MKCSETFLKRTPSAPQNSNRYRKVSATKRFLAYFDSKICSKAYVSSAAVPKVCQKASVGRGKSLKTIY